MRTTFAQIRPVLARQLNWRADGSDDARIMDYLNRALERLWHTPGLFDVLCRYRVCVRSGCITWPREIETIEAASVDQSPVPVRNGWYEFLGYGPGNMSADTGGSLQLLDRGEVCAFDDVHDPANRVGVYCDAQEEAGLQLLVRYVDRAGSAVFSSNDGGMVEGEYIDLPPLRVYAYTRRAVSHLVAVSKPVTKGYIRLYEYNESSGPVRPLAYYAPDETVPTYRRSVIVGIGKDSQVRSVQVMGRKRLRPVAHADDILPISHADALRLGVQAVRNEESGMLQEAMALWELARTALEEQAAHQRGQGADQPLKMKPAPWHRPIRNLI